MQVGLMAKGPLSICVDASRFLNRKTFPNFTSWQFYVGGVITECSDDLDHCVMITGFSDTAGWDGETYHVWNIRFEITTLFLILRNSWGEDWGYDGILFFKLKITKCRISLC